MTAPVLVRPEWIKARAPMGMRYRKLTSPAAKATNRAKDLTPLDALEEAAECLRLLAHPHRLRIVRSTRLGAEPRITLLHQPDFAEGLVFKIADKRGRERLTSGIWSAALWQHWKG